MRTGVDIASVNRFKKLINDEKFLNRVFSQDEIKHIFEHKTQIGQLERLAGKFCTKEAVSKALATGIGNGVIFKDIEVKIDAHSRPFVELKGKAKEIFNKLGFKEIEISISHDNGMAVAFCVLC